MSQISRLHESQITNGNIINADDLNGELNQLVNESNNQDTRLTAVESEATTLSGVKTFSNIPVLPASDPTSGNEAVRKAYVDSALNGLIIAPPPAYESSSTLSIPRFSVSRDTGIITKSTATTVNIASSGLNGTAQSENLTGTVSVTSGSATVTGSGTTFTSDFQVGDVIAVSGAQNRRITTISSDTSLAVESNFSATVSGANFKRGGEAPSSWYYLYVITNGTTPGLILSTRNVAGGDALSDLPTDYDEARQLPFSLRNNDSSNILPFFVGSGWPYRPKIVYRNYEYQTAPYAVLTNGTATSHTTVDLSSLIPPISKAAHLFCSVTLNSTGVIGYIRTPGSGATNGMQIGTTGHSPSLAASYQDIDEFETSNSQTIEYKSSGSQGRINIDVRGYTITEVF